jgi:glutamate transport system substrate-binding protein
MRTTEHPRIRRTALAAAAAIGMMLAVSACSGDNPVPGAGGSGSASGGISESGYQKVIDAGPVADASTVSSNDWAARIKKAGVLKRGGTDTGALFSLKDPTTGEVTGFDAGIGDLLARYIMGDDAKVELTQTSVDTRETLLQNNSVDVVLATYSITPERAQKVAFAGPYYTSGASVLVKKTNTDIKGVGDLAGKTVTTEASSTGVTAVQQNAPKAKLLTFREDADCVAAVQQGRADAYVLDETILLSDAVSNPELKVVGKPFTEDPYGVGVNKDDPAAKAFVNAFLTKIEQDGTWAKLWKATVGTVVEGDAPTPPEIGSVEGS